jgi:hypothetical protein
MCMWHCICQPLQPGMCHCKIIVIYNYNRFATTIEQRTATARCREFHTTRMYVCSADSQQIRSARRAPQLQQLQDLQLFLLCQLPPAKLDQPTRQRRSCTSHVRPVWPTVCMTHVRCGRQCACITVYDYIHPPCLHRN